MNILIIDIGGTNIKYALSDENANISNKNSKPTEAHLGAEPLFKKVCGIIEETLKIKKLDGIAISTAGQVNPHTGTIVHATDAIPNYSGFKLKEKLEERYSLRTSVENDVNSAALGEMWKGTVEDDNFIALTLGTGIGGSIVIDKKIHHGSSYSAGEIGHITIVSGGIKCNCGDCGCFERYASSRALDAYVEEAMPGTSTKDFFDLLREKDKLSVEIFNKWLNYLTDGLKSLVHVFNPSLILIGGAITVQGEFLENAIRKKINEKIMSSFRGSLKIKLMTLGNDANLYGALYWFLESGKNNDI